MVFDSDVHVYTDEIMVVDIDLLRLGAYTDITHWFDCWYDIIDIIRITLMCCIVTFRNTFRSYNV